MAAPRSYILLLWFCPLIRIGIKARDFIQVPQTQTRKNVLFFSAAAVKPAVGLPFLPPYGFTQLGGLIIDSLMTSNMLSEPVRLEKKNNKKTDALTHKKNPARA